MAGDLITSGVGFDGMIALFNYLWAKDNAWKVVPMRASCGGTKADFVGILYHSGVVELNGLDISQTFASPVTTAPHPWNNAYGGLASYKLKNGTDIDFDGRNPYTVKFAKPGGTTDTTTLACTLVVDPVPVPVVPPTVLTITSPATLPSAIKGVAYSATLTAAAVVGPATWSLKAGDNLPVPLTLGAATGIISGTPTTVGVTNFTVELKVGTKTVSLATKIEVKTLSIATPSPLPFGAPGEYYEVKLDSADANGVVTWSVAALSALPAGLTLDPATGVISGVPQGAATSNFTIDVRDSGAVVATASKAFQLDVAATQRFNTAAALPNVVKGAPYALAFKVSGGYTPRIFTVSGGALPAGVVLSADGNLTGSPTTAGNHNFTVKVESREGFLLMGLHAPPQGGKNYIAASNVTAVRTITTVREISDLRGATPVAICGDFNCCDLPCCATKNITGSTLTNRDAFAFLRVLPFQQRGFAADKTSLKNFPKTGNPKNTLYNDWKANSFDHVFTAGFANTAVKNASVRDLVALHANYAASYDTVTLLPKPNKKTVFNQILREVLWPEGVSDHLPVRFTLEI
jgi:hypothetical protein